MMRWKLGAIWVGLQVAFFAAWAATEEARLGEGVGRSILVRTVPVDPRDLLRGQYLQLAYEFSSVRRFASSAEGLDYSRPVWVVLRPEGDFYIPTERLLQARPENLDPQEVAIQGTAENPWRLLFGIEKFFVPEGTQLPNQRDITVRLRVGNDGKPRIEQVYVKGVPWP
jgi:uncharacterized membrane-anchored protein